MFHLYHWITLEAALSDDRTAVNDQILTCDESVKIRCEKRNRIGDFLWFGEPAHWNSGNERPPLIRIQYPINHISLRGTWAHCIH